jgi:PKD repeat protein
MCQGFYVHSTGATALNALESNKVGGNSTFLKMTGTSSSASSNPLIRLYLDQGGYRNETVLYLQSGATDGFDADYDAYKLPGNDPAAAMICTEKNSKSFQINGVAPVSGNFTIPLKTLTGYAGTYTISADNISSFPAGACITLYDKFTGISTNLKTSKYTFNLADTTTVARFDLNITINPLVITSSNSQPNCSAPSSGEITAKGTNAGPWNYYWKNSSGNPIKTTLNKATADTLQNLSGGAFHLEVNTVGMCDNNSSSFAINPVSIPVAQFSCADTVDLNVGGIVNFTNSSINAASYLWDFGDGSANSGSSSPTHVYSSAGIYTVTLICNSSTGCSDTSFKKVYVLDEFVGITSLSKTNSDLLVKTLAENEFVIQGKVDGKKTVKFKMNDAFGKQVADFGESRPDAINLHLNLKHLSSGIYFLNISGEDGKTVVKLPVR